MYTEAQTTVSIYAYLDVGNLMPVECAACTVHINAFLSKMENKVQIKILQTASVC